MSTSSYLVAPRGRWAALLLALGARSGTLPAQAGFAAPAGTTAAPSRLPGVSAARLARIDTIFDAAVADGAITGAVLLVLRDGRVMYERAAGWADRESGRRMKPDAIFRIASQTKALTSVSIMALVEQGKIWLDAPVSTYIPAFAKTTVRAAGATAAVPAKRPITIRDLMTHTAGISYGGESAVSDAYRAAQLGPAAGWGWYFADKTEPICTTIERLATLPFVRQPGEAFVYGYNTDILGCVVEKVSGMSLEAFFRTRITAPLRMVDTHFYLPESKRARLTTVYRSDSTNHSVRAPDGARGQGHYIDGPRNSFSGGAGLVSTAGDYARFLQMMLNGGVLDGARILAPRTVELMTTNMTGTMFSPDGRGFGLGFSVVGRFGSDDFRSVGSFGWGGAYGSSYVVDPKEKLVIVYMIQQLPTSSNVGLIMSDMVYQALVPVAR